MSKTNRKAKVGWCWSRKTLASHIADEMVDFKGTQRVRRRRSDEEYDQLDRMCQESYDAEVLERGSTTYRTECIWRDEIVWRTVFKRKPSRYKYIVVELKLEDALVLWELDYNRRFRDGAHSDKRNGYFKRDCARTMRRDNNKFCNKVLKDDWDQTAYPRYSDTDFKRWVWW
jgi:hypothetical protein